MSSLRFRFACALVAFALPGVLTAVACDRPGGGGGGGSGGAGGEGGCPMAPEPMLTITVRAQDGPVPPDTSLRVTWSVGEEPLFRLNDPSTWKTLDDANVICDVDRTQPPPEDLPALSCQLWTNGPTRVEVQATGYQAYDETLTPGSSELCEGPVPKHVDIEILREQDGGPPP